MPGDNSTPRNPRDLQALIKFCLHNTKSEDAPASVVANMDPERREWLQNALNSMSVDVFQELAKGIELLSDESIILDPNGDVSKQIYALECIEDWVGQIDLANNFHRLGGFTCLELCLKSPHVKLQCCTCHVIAELAQNNPYCQEKFVEEGFLTLLLDIMKQAQDNDLQAKTLYAVSSIVRDCPKAKELFLEEQGLEAFQSLLQVKNERIVTKICFMLSSLLEEGCQVVKNECKVMGFTQALVTLLQGPHDKSHEHIARALLLISKNSPEVIKEFGNQSFEDLLNDKKAFVKGKDEFLEEYNHYENLINLYFSSNCAKTGNDVDR